jgi:hypothetical protein
MDNHTAAGPFIPPFEEAGHEDASRAAFHPYSQVAAALGSPNGPDSGHLNSYVNGHHRQVSRADIEENVFPDENIPNINIRMQPRIFPGQDDPALVPDIARIASNESPVGPTESGTPKLPSGPSHVPSLRGGAGSPQQ